MEKPQDLSKKIMTKTGNHNQKKVIKGIEEDGIKISIKNMMITAKNVDLERISIN